MDSMYTDRDNLYRKLCQDVLWLRLCEEKLTELYNQQEMRTPTHFGTGQEAIAVGVCNALQDSDVVYSHHRCHNHYLAMGGSIFELAAELYGKEGGCSQGRGGSVHLTARDKGFIISSAILAETIAVATGSALAFKLDNSPRVSVSFFGDAACEEGVFYESLNYAVIKKLPVLFVCENNLYSAETPRSVRQAEGSNLYDRALSLKINAEVIDGNNVISVHHAVEGLLPKLRAGEGPFFLECMTYRWREHVGAQFDYDVPNRTFRSEQEQKHWINEKCPLKFISNYLVNNSIATEIEINSWKNEQELELIDALTRAKESAWPDVSTLLDNVI